MRIQIFKVNTENGLEVQGVRQGVRAPAVLKEMGKVTNPGRHGI